MAKIGEAAFGLANAALIDIGEYASNGSTPPPDGVAQ